VILKDKKEGTGSVARKIRAAGTFDAAILFTNSTRSTLEIWRGKACPESSATTAHCGLGCWMMWSRIRLGIFRPSIMRCATCASPVNVVRTRTMRPLLAVPPPAGANSVRRWHLRRCGIRAGETLAAGGLSQRSRIGSQRGATDEWALFGAPA